jgi:hypothetical protein
MIIHKFAITIKVLVFLFLVSLILSSCQKDEIISTNTSYKLEFSTDTIIFDTVFTTVGATTRYLKVYNRNKERISISHLYLAEGSNSQYQINIDGTPGVSLNNIELDAEDSLFIFIKVTVDPTNQNAPLIISDSIVFETNGNIQDVDLVAWGQDVHFFVGNKKIDGLSYPYIIVANENETVNWEDDKPYVIYGWAVVDSTGVLNIGPGCNIHFHQNSGMWVYRGGSIHVNGQLDSVVTFQGDRLEMDYQNLPGQWDRIWINESGVNSEFNYAVIKNGFIGIQAETTNEDLGNTLLLKNTIIQNMSLWGLFTFAYRVNATNSVFANCAEKTLFLSVGGSYDFRHCTFADYWSSTVRLEPSLVISNNLTKYNENGEPVTYLGDLDNAYFGNCIIFGSNDEEIILSKYDQVLFNYKFDHCILKTELEITDPLFFINCQKNIDPLFVDAFEYNYRIDTLSPAINIGNIEIVNGSLIDITLDLDGNSRNSDEGPDLGAYEFIPQLKNR